MKYHLIEQETNIDWKVWTTLTFKDIMLVPNSSKAGLIKLT